MKKILIVQLRKLGDVILTTPIIDVLYKKFENDVIIDFLTEPQSEEVLTDNPMLRQVLVLDKSSVKEQLKLIWKLRSEKYDYVFDFFGNPRSAQLTFLSGVKKRYGYDYPIRHRLYNHCVKRDRKSKYVVDFKMDLLRDLDIEPGFRKTSIYFKREMSEDMRHYLCEHGWDGKSKILAIATPNVRDVSLVKNWLFERYAELGSLVQKDLGAFVLILWGPGEKDIAEDIYYHLADKEKACLAPDLSIKELSAMLSLTDVLLTGCGGSKHVAVAVGTPTVTIFGPTQEICWNPPNSLKNIAVKAKELECLQCDKTECDDRQCMKRVTVGMVFKAVTPFLS
ncbi:MAG: glycosyltransferase family 9 protein [bacterium]|nr:glycosyltransferase family 9 protein [bacterium]